MKTIAYDLNEFHPTLREEAGHIIEMLNQQVPPFGRGSVMIRVSDTFMSGHLNNPKPTSMADKGYGLSSHNAKTGETVITLAAHFFGHDADFAGYREKKLADYANRFHGEMMTLGADIIHEYGHAFLGMLQQTFLEEDIDRGNRVTKAFQGMMQVAEESRMKSPFTFFLFRLSKQPYSGGLVSSYAETSQDEFFAETFAALFCDKTKAENKTVILMDTLIKTAYSQIKDVGESVVNAAVPFFFSELARMDEIEKRIEEGNYHATPADIADLMKLVDHLEHRTHNKD